jgi:hypothetical protein
VAEDTSLRRGARAVTFAVLMSVTAVAAHALSGGMVPGPRVVAASTAVVFGAAWWLAARRRHGLVLAVAAVCGQLGLHAVYALSMRSANRAHALATILCGSPHGHHMATMTGMPRPMPMWSADPMTAAHCVAAVVVVLVARYGEDLASFVARIARAIWIFELPVHRVRPGRPAISRHEVAAQRCSGLLWACGLGLRGPPSQLA